MWCLLRSWWRAGESSVSVVYRQSWAAALIVLGVSACVLFFLPGARTADVGAVLVAGCLRGVAESRRALIFNDGELLVRPPFAGPRAIDLAQVASARPCSVRTSFLLVPASVKGVLLVQRGGHEVRVPTDFPSSAEISRRLTAVGEAAARLPSADQARRFD